MLFKSEVEMVIWIVDICERIRKYMKYKTLTNVEPNQNNDNNKTVFSIKFAYTVFIHKYIIYKLTFDEFQWNYLFISVEQSKHIATLNFNYVYYYI